MHLLDRRGVVHPGEGNQVLVYGSRLERSMWTIEHTESL